MREGDLWWATLRKAILHEADLSGARLQGADLVGADLSGAKLRTAFLDEADLTGATGITSEELEKQTIMPLQGTTMPDGSIHP